MAGTHFSGPIKQGSASQPLSGDVGGLSGAVTLTAEESNGKNYMLDGGTGFGITLPAPTQGWKCRFTVGAAFTTDYVFTAATAGQLQGSIMEVGAIQLCAAKDTITLEDGAESIGDFLEFSSDGTSILVFGNFAITASVTPA